MPTLHHRIDFAKAFWPPNSWLPSMGLEIELSPPLASIKIPTYFREVSCGLMACLDGDAILDYPSVPVTSDPLDWMSHWQRRRVERCSRDQVSHWCICFTSLEKLREELGCGKVPLQLFHSSSKHSLRSSHTLHFFNVPHFKVTLEYLSQGWASNGRDLDLTNLSDHHISLTASRAQPEQFVHNAHSNLIDRKWGHISWHIAIEFNLLENKC